MTLEEADHLSVEQLHETRDRSLVEAYVPHDVGQDYLIARLKAHGYDVVEHGDDARHADEVFFGDGPDLLVEYDGTPLGYIEVKTKEDPQWFGCLNLRHFREYVNHANDVDVPVFIWFAYLDSETETIHREAFVEVTGEEQIDGELTDVGDEEIVVQEDDVQAVEASSLVTVDGSDVLTVDSSETIVEYIPDVFGNEVVTLDNTDFRNFAHVRRLLDENYTGTVDHSVTDTVTASDVAAGAGQSPTSQGDSDDVDVDERIREVTEAVVPDVPELRRLFREALVVNPAYSSIVQIRTDEGRMGPEVDEETTVTFTVTETGNVCVTVGKTQATTVTLGVLD